MRPHVSRLRSCRHCFARSGDRADGLRPGAAAGAARSRLLQPAGAVHRRASGPRDPTRHCDALDPRARWRRALARRALPQLKRHLDKADQSGRVTAPSDLKSFLDKLDRQATNELDRRALLDAQQYLQQMMKQGPGQKGEHLARSGGPGEEDPNADGAEEKNHNSMPGKEPGKRDAEYRSLPEFRAGPTTQVKGALGEGESSSVVFKGKPTPGKSTVAQADVVASYRRQAEQELNSERVPEALKETIKNYFLSLGQENR